MNALSTRSLEIPDEVAEAILAHVHSDVENEVGGVLLGTLVAGASTVTAVLPALEAVGGAAQLTFTHEVWEGILSAVDRDHPDQQIVGWYHSHPGHGVFLSSYDQFIHENFFGAQGMVALVVDPRDDDAFGWFGWDGEKLVRVDSDLPVDRPDRAEVPREVATSLDTAAREERRATVLRDGATVFLAVLLVFGVGYWLGARPAASAADRSLAREAQLQQANAQLRAVLVDVCRSVLAGSPQAAPRTGGSPATDLTSPEPAPSGDAQEPTAAASTCAQVLPQRPAPAPAPPSPVGEGVAPEATPTPSSSSGP